MVSESLITSQDVELLGHGRHIRLYERLGAHLFKSGGARGVLFSVLAPGAEGVSVIGDFNGHDSSANPLKARTDGSGVWEGFVPGIGEGSSYRYAISNGGREARLAEKRDPFTFLGRNDASVVCGLGYAWSDRGWMEERAAGNTLDSPISIYEMDPGSWRRVPEEENRGLTPRELAGWLADYVKDTGFTHVEFFHRPGQARLFAPAYGEPEEFMRLVDSLHSNGIGVIVGFNPFDLPADEYGLSDFDGTPLYEGRARSREFDHSSPSVRSFLLSSALFWLDRYHVDGLRARFPSGTPRPETIEFLKDLNETVYSSYPGALTVAETSLEAPPVSRPLYTGGLGFGLKSKPDFGRSLLGYMETDPLYRKYRQNELVSGVSSSENLLLAISSEEVLDRSLFERMPGDEWQRFANLRLLFGFQYAQPGKKLLFMGGEFGQRERWRPGESLSWHLLENPLNRGLKRWVRDLNTFYRGEAALHKHGLDPEGGPGGPGGAAGFEWVDYGDADKSVISLLRRAGGETVLVVFNFTPVPRHNYRVGVPSGGVWKELLNSDAPIYGGSGQGNIGGREAAPVPFHSRYHSLSLTLPPLAVVFFKKG